MTAVKTETTTRAIRVPEFLREPFEAAQHRLEQFEGEAQKLVRDLVDRGRASRKDIEQMVHRLSKQDWTFPELKQRIEKLREQSAERAAEWRGRAETFRSEALDRLIELQAKAVQFLGVATRDQVEDLSKELDRLAKRVETAQRGNRKGKKGARGAEV